MIFRRALKRCSKTKDNGLVPKKKIYSMLSRLAYINNTAFDIFYLKNTTQ